MRSGDVQGGPLSGRKGGFIACSWIPCTGWLLSPGRSSVSTAKSGSGNASQNGQIPDNLCDGRQYEGEAPLNACCQPRRPCAACTMLTSICAATGPSAPNPQATTPTPHPHGSSKKGMTSMSLNPSHTNAVKRPKRVRRDSKKTVPGGIRTLDLDIANHKKSIKGWLIRVTR